jgi:hypothetical protein
MRFVRREGTRISPFGFVRGVIDKQKDNQQQKAKAGPPPSAKDDKQKGTPQSVGLGWMESL